VPYFGYYSLLNVATAILLVAVLSAAGIILSAWGSLALTVKRLHDMGMTGAHILWITPIAFVSYEAGEAAHSLVPKLVGVCIALWLLFAPGQAEDNEYGPAPTRKGRRALLRQGR
jgi:uncharacterized membrane protein YhaH (DUF805 family)